MFLVQADGAEQAVVGILADDIHHVVDGDASQQLAVDVHHRGGQQVTVLEQPGDVHIRHVAGDGLNLAVHDLGDE